MPKFTYRGKNLKELKKMSLKEFAQLLPSRKRRSLNRLSEEKKKFLEKLKSTDEPVRTHHRDMIVVPAMIGKKIAVHNGQEFTYLEIKPEMLGHYLGELTLTRERVEHSAAGIGATRSTKFISVK